MSYYVTSENSVLNINNAHLKVSGNIQTDVMKLGAIEFAPPASDVPGTVNFTNVTTGVTTSSNLNVGGTLMLGSVELATATAALEQTVNLGNVTSNTVQFTNATTSLVASGNVVVTGNVTADYFVGDGSNITGISSTSNLQVVTDTGNVTSNTVQFSNAITGFVTTANVEVGGELTVSGNVAIDTDTLFVDSVNDRVGIGTNSPNEPLDIYGAGIRIHHLGAEPKIDFLRGGTNRTPSGALNTFGAANYTDWRIGAASGANLKFQQQYTGANSGNIIDVMTMNYGTGNVEIPGYLKTGNPAFYAYRTAAGNADESYITYQLSYVNLGNHMNVTAGIFTCPVAGIYTFTWGAIGGTNNHVHRHHIRKNNSPIGDVHLRLDTSAGKYGDGERTVMLSLAANDTIRIYYKDSDGTDADYGYNYTYLQGHLISYT